MCASLRAELIQGDIQLAYAGSAFADTVFKKDFGQVVKATTEWRVGDFAGEETVFAGVTLLNTSTKPVFFHYYVAFFDKDKNLVGATGQGSVGNQGLPPGQQTLMGSCLIHLPKGKYKDITSYQAVIYETDAASNDK
jgi:hypothetical protein